MAVLKGFIVVLVVVRCKLSAKSKSLTYTLDGESATDREINVKMAELSIQVGGLW